MIEIEVPSHATASIEGDSVVLKGQKGASVKKFNRKFSNVSMENGRIRISEPVNKKILKQYAPIETALANEIKKAFSDVENGLEVKMKMVYSHFPMSLEIKNNEMIVKNLFGRKVARKARILGQTKVLIKGQDITITGADSYDVGQTVANIRHSCKITKYDSRVFQDGIYISREE